MASLNTTKTGINFIGKALDTPTYFKGKIGLVNVWDAALTDEQILANYDSYANRITTSISSSDYQQIEIITGELGSTEKNKQLTTNFTKYLDLVLEMSADQTNTQVLSGSVQYTIDTQTVFQPQPIRPSQHAPKPTKL